MRNGKPDGFVLPVLFLLLFLIAIVLGYVMFSEDENPAPKAAPKAAQQYLEADASPQQAGFRMQDVPSWLFVHVAVIASLQVGALIAAYLYSQSETLSRSQAATVQFLCEIPMYLGLFGTLLGVCLTQFITGSLVAPLAYLTTMSGIVLHVFGKLAIWLPKSANHEPEP